MASFLVPNLDVASHAPFDIPCGLEALESSELQAPKFTPVKYPKLNACRVRSLNRSLDFVDRVSDGSADTM